MGGLGGGEEEPEPRSLLGRVASVPSDGSVVMAQHSGAACLILCRSNLWRMRLPLPCTHPMISPSNSNILASPKAGDVRRSHGTAVNPETRRGRGLVPGPAGASWCLNWNWSSAPDARACLSHSITWGPDLDPDSVAKDFLQVWKDVCVETRFQQLPRELRERREGGKQQGWSCSGDFRAPAGVGCLQGGNVLILQLRKVEGLVACLGSQPCLQK